MISLPFLFECDDDNYLGLAPRIVCPFGAFCAPKFRTDQFALVSWASLGGAAGAGTAGFFCGRYILGCAFIAWACL